ncbi:MAG: O-antigen ligase family protein [Candidatus Magasanikiibacteriota bacterium]
MQKKHLETFIKILVYATFFVPLVVIPSSYIFPFIVPKILLIRSLVVLMFGAYILLLAINWQEYKPRFTPVNMAIGLFYFSFLLSTFVGVDWYKSFWDNHERMLGLFTITHFALYYLVLSSVFKSAVDWKWFLRIFLGAGFLVMFVGFWQQYVNPQALLNNGGDRVSATLGNPIYFSGYGLFLLFIGYYLWIKEKGNNFWRTFAVVGGLFGFLGIFWGVTRGAVLGLLAGVGVLCFSYIITLKEHKKIQQIMAGAMILIIVMMGIFYAFRQTDFVKNIPAVGRLVNTTLDPKTPRYMAWGIALDAWKDKPIFGWGPNNYFYAFNKFYRPEFLESGWGETWFDNAHNVVMNTLAVQGGVGIITYLSMFGVAIFILWKEFKQKKIDAHMVSVGSAFFVAHLVSMVTVFENPTSYLYFFFFMAFVNAQSGYSDQPAMRDKALRAGNPDLQIKKEKIKNNSLSIGLIITVVCAVSLFIYSTDINPARANKNTLLAIRGLYQNQDAVELFKLASSVPSPHIDDIRNDFVRTATQAITQLIQNKQIDKAKALFDLSYGEIQKNILLHPLDIRAHIQQAQLAFLGVNLKQDPLYFLQAEQVLVEALKNSPKRQQIQYMLSGLELQLGKKDEAIKLAQDSVDNDPLIGESWWRLALIYNEMGKKAEAVATIQKALDQGIVFDDQGKQVTQTILGITSTNR